MKAGQGSLGDDELPSECLGYHVSGRREGRGQGQEVAMAGTQFAPNEGRAGSQKGSHRAGFHRPQGRVLILFSVQ